MNVSIVPTLKVLKSAAMMIVVAVAGLVVGYYANAMFFPGTSPEQPIEFSHLIHAGENEIPCLYCHVQARRSISAGVPSMSNIGWMLVSTGAPKSFFPLIISVGTVERGRKFCGTATGGQSSA